MDKYSLLKRQPVDLLLHHTPVNTYVHLYALNRNAMETACAIFVPAVKVMAHFSGSCEDIQCSLRSLAIQYVDECVRIY